MKLVKQPRGSRVCGQACVAMLADTDLKNGIKLVGHVGGTWGHHLAAALKRAYVPCADKLVRGEPDGDALLFFKYPSNRRHWVVWYDGKYYDPLEGIFRRVPKYLRRAQITSHLPFFLP